MCSRICLFLSLVLVLPIAALAAPQEQATDGVDFAQRSQGERAKTLEDMSDTEALELRPMLQHIRMALLTQRATLNDLENRRTATTNPEVRRQLDREVAQVKLGTERRMLEIQIEYARAEGRKETVASLENALKIFTAVPAPSFHKRTEPDATR